MYKNKSKSHINNLINIKRTCKINSLKCKRKLIVKLSNNIKYIYR